MGLATWANTHSYTPTPHPPSNLDYRRSGVCRLDTKKSTTHEPPPPQTQLAIDDVEAGAELGEGRGRETLGEDVGELGGGWDVEDLNINDGDPITNEV